MNTENKMLDFTQCEWEERSAYAKLLVYQQAEKVTVALGEMKPGGPHKPHSHLYEQIILVLGGEANLHIEQQIHHMGPGCIMAIPPNAVHMFEPIGEQNVYYVDIFAPKRPDQTGYWVDPLGEKRPVAPKEERIQSKIADKPENRASLPFLLKTVE